MRYAVSALFVVLCLGVVVRLAQAESGTINTIDQFTSTTSPSSAITQRTWGKAIKLTGLSTGLCLTLDVNNLITTTSCGGGGAGSGTVATSSDLVAGQVDFSTGVNTIGNDSTFLFDTSTKKLTATNASTTLFSAVTGYFNSLLATSTTATSSFSGAVSLTANQTQGTSANNTTDGELNIQNTNNNGLGLQVYTNVGASNVSPLVLFRSDNTAATQGVLWLLQDGTNGGAYNLKLQGPAPQIEFVEADQASPAGKFEIGVNGDFLYFDSRNAADSSFETDVVLRRTASGGMFGIGTSSPYAKLSVVGQAVAEYFTATSTSLTSTFPYASTTMVTATTASTTNLILSSAGGVGTRCLQAAADGTVSANASACGSGSGGIGNPFTNPAAGQSATTSLMLFNGQASSTQLSAGLAYFGLTATSSFSGTGALTLATALTVANGGTGTTTATSGQLFYGGGAGVYQSVATSSFTPNADFSTTGTIGAFVGGAASTVALNMGTAHAWTALQNFANASSSLFSAGKAWFGLTASTTIDGTGNIVVPSGSNLTVTGKTDGCATWATGVLNSTGVACGSGGGSFPFSADTNYGQVVYSTSTPTLWFKSGLFASSTSQFEVINVASTTATSTFSGPVQLGATAGNNLLRITAAQNYPTSLSVGGAVNLTNTSNTGPAVVVYTNQAAPAGRLFVINSDNAAFNQTAFRVVQDGTGNAADIVSANVAGGGAGGAALSLLGDGGGGSTSGAHALSISLTGTGNANASGLNLVSANTAASAVQISGVETGRGTIKVTHTGTGTDGNAAALSLDLAGSGTASQGLFIDASGGGTTGKILNLRNNGLEHLTLDSTGKLGIGSSSPSSMLSLMHRDGATFTNIFTIASSTASATTTLFNVNNNGQTAITTPTSIATAFGVSTSTVGNPIFGVDTTNTAGNIFSIATTTGTIFWGIDRVGHIFATTSTPTLSSCGTSPSMTGGDSRGTITTGATASGCTVTFGTAYTNVPSCVVTPQTGSVINTFSYTVSASAITATETGLGGGKFDYICMGN